MFIRGSLSKRLIENQVQRTCDGKKMFFKAGQKEQNGNRKIALSVFGQQFPSGSAGSWRAKADVRIPVGVITVTTHGDV